MADIYVVDVDAVVSIAMYNEGSHLYRVLWHFANSCYYILLQRHTYKNRLQVGIGWCVDVVVQTTQNGSAHFKQNRISLTLLRLDCPWSLRTRLYIRVGYMGNISWHALFHKSAYPNTNCTILPLVLVGNTWKWKCKPIYLFSQLILGT